MASISKIGSRWRALIRKGGHNRCQTFATQAQAKAFARVVESEIDEIKSTGRMQPRDTSFADLIKRYDEEFYPSKKWGRSKAADLKRLSKGLGHISAAKLDYKNMFDYFIEQRDKGCGGVGISSQAGYLVNVLQTASEVWRLHVPVQAALDVRGALKKLGMVKRSNSRGRRVLNSEVAQVIKHLERKASALPLADIVWFCLASAMRISEVCRLQWSDLNETDRTIVIRDRKHPTEKHGNHQTVPLLTVAGLDAFEIATRQRPVGQSLPKYIFRANPKTITAYFTDAVRDAEINDLHLHDLRHEAISRLFEAGYRIEQVSVVSGHRDWSMLKRYTHLRAVDLHRAPAAP